MNIKILSYLTSVTVENFYKIEKVNLFTVDLSIFSSGATILLNGAGSENRTRAIRSEA